MKNPVLTIDVGNTSVTTALFTHKGPVKNMNFGTEKVTCKYILQRYRSFLSAGIRARGAVFCSVVPSVNKVFRKAFMHLKIRLMAVNRGTGWGFRNLYYKPEEVGFDRLATAKGALQKYSPPLIIVDFGTATTFDWIDENGDYRGGVIAPGIRISAQALWDHTAQLPRFPLVAAESVIGRSTAECMQSGVYYGTIGQIKEILLRMKKHIGRNMRVISCGGYAKIFLESGIISTYEPNLIHYGLFALWKERYPS